MSDDRVARHLLRQTREKVAAVLDNLDALLEPDPGREPEVVDEPGVGAVVPGTRVRAFGSWAGQHADGIEGEYVRQAEALADSHQHRVLINGLPWCFTRVEPVTPAAPTPTEGDGDAVEALALMPEIPWRQGGFSAAEVERYGKDCIGALLAAGYRRVGDDK